jgi:hypothetical protein
MRKNDKGYELTEDGQLVHRVVYRETYGEIPKNWHVHHIDWTKENNHPDNLIAVPEAVHKWIHERGDPKWPPQRLEIGGLVSVWQRDHSPKEEARYQEEFRQAATFIRKCRRPEARALRELLRNLQSKPRNWRKKSKKINKS